MRRFVKSSGVETFLKKSKLISIPNSRNRHSLDMTEKWFKENAILIIFQLKHNFVKSSGVETLQKKTNSI
jgi:hypothetical protein